MGKALVDAVADRAVVVQGGKHLFHFVKHILDAHHVQKSLLLTCKRSVGQVFGGSGRTHGKAGLVIARRQRHEGLANRLL